VIHTYEERMKERGRVHTPTVQQKADGGRTQGSRNPVMESETTRPVKTPEDRVCSLLDYKKKKGAIDFNMASTGIDIGERDKHKARRNGAKRLTCVAGV